MGAVTPSYEKNKKGVPEMTDLLDRMENRVHELAERIDAAHDKLEIELAALERIHGKRVYNAYTVRY